MGISLAPHCFTRPGGAELSLCPNIKGFILNTPTNMRRIRANYGIPEAEFSGGLWGSPVLCPASTSQFACGPLWVRAGEPSTHPSEGHAWGCGERGAGGGGSEGAGRALGFRAGAWQARCGRLHGVPTGLRPGGRSAGISCPISRLINEPFRDPRPQNLLACGGLAAHRWE